ncbi:hypothetical protein CON84_03730 [Bacillus sp. AFS094228]|nr:hypothetical protein CON84_03730 [Bacillus sp. AFS094228]
MRNVTYIFITSLIWILSGTFLFIHSKGLMNVSPWGMHTFENITIQIVVILLPFIGLFLSILIKKRVIKYVMILGCLMNIYFLSIPFTFAWLHYFQVI